jgi:aryl-alcohol dehydrogenase-like predicted oxidoreductase
VGVHVNATPPAVPAQVLESLWAPKEHHLVRTVVEQTPYSLLDRRVERELLPMAQTYGVGITVWSPPSGGVLTGKYRAGPAEPADGPRDSRFGTDDTNSDWTRKHFNLAADTIVDAVVQMARDKGCSPAQLSLAWLLAQPAVSSVIIGARDEEALRTGELPVPQIGPNQIRPARWWRTVRRCRMDW